MADRSRNKELAARIRGARRLAGFKSARLAAQAHGWSEALYRAQESMNRGVGADDVARISAAYDVTVDWLLHGVVNTARDRNAARKLTETSEDRRREDARLRKLRGKRLSTARILAGFALANDAADYYGWRRDTLYGHESGRNTLSLAARRLYCAAFGITDAWLEDGTKPSGLGDEVDGMSEDGSGAGRLTALADAGRRGDIKVVQALALSPVRKARKPPSTSPVERCSGLIELVGSSGEEAYASLLIHLRGKGSGRHRLARVLSATPDLRFQPGDLLIVAASRRNVEPSAYVVVRELGDVTRVLTYNDYLAVREVTHERMGVDLTVGGAVLALIRAV